MITIQLEGSSALVTGASKGIGAAAAKTLAAAGCGRLFLHYASDLAGAEHTAALCRELGAETSLLQADLSSRDAIFGFTRTLEPIAPEIDLLVNNAGHLIARSTLADFSEELYDRVMNLNTKSLWFISQTVARAMIARRKGVIVHVSSIAARHGGGPGATVYAAAKAAVSAMTKGMAKELAPHGIRVTAISPGTVDNDFHAKYSTREILDAVAKSTPQGRLSTNQDMADVIVFLCSTASANILGQTIEINGGAYLV
jgi:3-oxoacyl-[acyl-carrier protein] reductase